MILRAVSVKRTTVRALMVVNDFNDIDVVITTTNEMRTRTTMRAVSLELVLVHGFDSDVDLVFAAGLPLWACTARGADCLVVWAGEVDFDLDRVGVVFLVRSGSHGCSKGGRR